MPEDSRITIRAGSGWLFGVFPAMVMLDGVQVAMLTAGEPTTVSVSPGAHRLWLSTGTNRSNIERPTIQPGELAVYEYGSSFQEDWHSPRRYFWWAAPWLGYATCHLRLKRVTH